MNLEKLLLLEQLMLLGRPCPLQPCCGHQCNVAFLTFCSISSAIISLWPLSPRGPYVFFSRLWEDVDHLLQAAFYHKCISVGKHPAGFCCYEGWSLLPNYCAFLVQKIENTQMPMISEEVFRWKPGYFPGIQPGCFHPSLTTVFSCPIKFWDFPRITCTVWCSDQRGPKCALNCGSSPLAKVMVMMFNPHHQFPSPFNQSSLLL